MFLPVTRDSPLTSTPRGMSTLLRGGALRNTAVCQTYVVDVRALWYAMACVPARRATKLLMRTYQNHTMSTANVSIGGTVETTARRVLKSKVEPKLSCDARDLEKIEERVPRLGLSLGGPRAWRPNGVGARRRRAELLTNSCKAPPCSLHASIP